MFWDPEVGLCLFVGADVDAVDELAQELFGRVWVAVLEGLLKAAGDAAAIFGVG